MEHNENMTADAATAESAEATVGIGIVAMVGRQQGMEVSCLQVVYLQTDSAVVCVSTMGVLHYCDSVSAYLGIYSTRVPE